MKKKQWTKIRNSIAALIFTAVMSGCQTGGVHPFTTMFEKKYPHLEIEQAVHELSVPETASANTAEGQVVTAMHETSPRQEASW